MSSLTAETKTAQDLTRSLEFLQSAYARASGRRIELVLHTEDSSRRGYHHYRLTADGYSVTEWIQAKPGVVWLALLDMRRAVEVLDKS
jgi:hypothetical protein